MSTRVGRRNPRALPKLNPNFAKPAPRKSNRCPSPNWVFSMGYADLQGQVTNPVSLVVVAAGLPSKVAARTGRSQNLGPLLCDSQKARRRSSLKIAGQTLHLPVPVADRVEAAPPVDSRAARLRSLNPARFSLRKRPLRRSGQIPSPRRQPPAWEPPDSQARLLHRSSEDFMEIFRFRKKMSTRLSARWLSAPQASGGFRV